MKLKSVFGALVAFGAMALMAVGVQAATYSAGVVSPEAGVAQVPVVVTPDESETSVSVNGYVMKLTYDKTKVTPKISATKDATGEDCYATVGTDFSGANTVLVSDVVQTDGNNETLAVAWASDTPVTVSAAATMAMVDFTVADGTTGSVPITVELTALTNDGTATTTATVANGAVTIPEDFMYGDVDGTKTVTSEDASLIAQHVAGLITLDTKYNKAADVDGSSAITSEDASLVAQYVAGLIDKFPAEQ